MHGKTGNYFTNKQLHIIWVTSKIRAIEGISPMKVFKVSYEGVYRSDSFLTQTSTIIAEVIRPLHRVKDLHSVQTSCYSSAVEL